jgi:hypothetical protein
MVTIAACDGWTPGWVGRLQHETDSRRFRSLQLAVALAVLVAAGVSGVTNVAGEAFAQSAAASVLPSPSPPFSAQLIDDFSSGDSAEYVCGTSTSVDGNAVFSAVDLPTPTGDASGIYRFDLTTGQQSLLVPLTAGPDFPCGYFSGDGGAYAYIQGGGLFVLDTTSGSVVAVPVPSGGVIEDSTSTHIAFSDDHHYLFFEVDVSGITVVYRYDTTTQTLLLATPSLTGGLPEDSIGDDYTISSDGDQIAFDSSATNLTASEPAVSAIHAYVRDLGTATTTLLPGQLIPTLTTGTVPLISADGSTVAYELGTENEAVIDVAVVDLATDTEVSASSPPSGIVQGGSYPAAISGNGQVVVFNSGETDLVPGVTVPAPPTDLPPGYEYPLYVRDMSTGQTSLITESVDGPMAATFGGTSATIDRAGTMVAFLSGANDLVAGMNPAPYDKVYAYSLVTHTVTLVNAPFPQSPSPIAVIPYSPVISAVGQRIVYKLSGPPPESELPELANLGSPIPASQTTPTSPTSPTVAACSNLIASAPELGSAVGIATDDVDGCPGYLVVNAGGVVQAFGSAVWHGDLRATKLSSPIIGIAATSDGGGYWLLGADGGVFAFGDAHFFGSTGNLHLNAPVVGMAATSDNGGYWLVAKDGGVFTFGDASFHGSTGNLHLNQPVDGIAVAPGGNGYWLVASDGGVFTFTTDGFYGSLGNKKLNEPIVGMAGTSDGRGYSLVGADGGVFNFGDSTYYGSLGSDPPPDPVVDLAPTPANNGYYLVDRQGRVYAFGPGATYLGND